MSNRSNEYIFAPEGYQYTKGALSDQDVDQHDPFKTFHAWFSHAKSTAEVTSPEALTLSTAELPSGRVSARQVLLKEADSRGFVIYSNFATSKKGRDIGSNPQASMVFWWEPLQRQIRIEGRTERLSSNESQRYFDTRPRGSRLGAWASPQSQVISDRSELDQRLAKVEHEFQQDKEHIPVPEFWGGLRLIPLEVEFWQGRENRLHDRLVYSRDSVNSNEWSLRRLAP